MEVKKRAPGAGRPCAFCKVDALDRALDVFWRKGYDGTSLSDLTAAMGINRPSLYAAFGNKEALFRRAIGRYGERTAALLDEANERPTAREFVRFVLDTATAGFTNPAHPPGCFLVQGTGGCGDAGTPVREDVAANRAAMEAAVRGRFERAIVEGELPGDADAAALARYFTVVVQGMAVQAAGGAGAAELASVAAMAMRAWPGGRPRPEGV